LLFDALVRRDAPALKEKDLSRLLNHIL